jgi:hypothetical protein
MNRDLRKWAIRGKGEYWIVEDREIWCHPDDLAVLKRSLAQP